MTAYLLSLTALSHGLKNKNKANKTTQVFFKIVLMGDLVCSVCDKRRNNKIP